MWINAKVFMELVAKTTALELKCQALEARMEKVEKSPVVAQTAEDESKPDEVMKKLYHEMMDGVEDERIGRVRYTDGRD